MVIHLPNGLYVSYIDSVLMKNARGSTELVGEYRRVQNFIGLTNDIKDVQYIPPEPQKVPEYMQNLEQYINGNPYTGEHMNSLPPLIKVTMIHAQFESIHSLSNGNGRVGRVFNRFIF